MGTGPNDRIGALIKIKYMRIVFTICPTAVGIGATSVFAFHESMMFYKAIARDWTGET